MMLTWTVLACLVSCTSAAGDDNSTIITVIIAVTAAVVSAVIVIVIVIACIYYSRTKKTIKAKVKKQIINNAQKRTIYRPESISLDNYFKAFENEEKNAFFQEENVETKDETEKHTSETAEGKETNEFDNDTNISTGIERQRSLESLQLPQMKHLYAENEMTELLEENDETIYSELEELESTSGISTGSTLNRKLNTSKRKNWSTTFLKDYSEISKRQKQNYDRWKELSLLEGTQIPKGRSLLRRVKSVRTWHKTFGYFRKPQKSRLTKLKMNKVANEKTKVIKVKEASKDELREGCVNENSVLQEPETLIAVAYDKKDTSGKSPKSFEGSEIESNINAVTKNNTDSEFSDDGGIDTAREEGKSNCTPELGKDLRQTDIISIGQSEHIAELPLENCKIIDVRTMQTQAIARTNKQKAYKPRRLGQRLKKKSKAKATSTKHKQWNKKEIKNKVQAHTAILKRKR